MIATMLAEAWSALIANRLRSVLTMLGMIIGLVGAFDAIIAPRILKRSWTKK